MNFAEAESYLFSLGNEVETMKLGLANITALLEALGKPHERYKKVQVAGTNGKGSVCAFLNSICLEASIRTGMYTSPHLISIRERIKIDGADISEEDFARLVTIVKETSDSLVAAGQLDRIPTYFEQVTAIALLAFADANVELAILETGLGGRFDATTAANAEIAAITRIDLDHQEYLGDTIEEIVAEKAAIINSDMQDVVLGEQSREIMRLLRKHCSSLGIVPLNDEYEPWRILRNQDGTVKVILNLFVWPPVTLGLQGQHQIENAQTAIQVVRGLRNNGLRVEEEAVIKGLESAHHPGRLEYQGRYLFDGAHNVGGARVLQSYLDDHLDRPITLIFGAMKEKAVREMLELLAPKADSIILTKPYNTRALPPKTMARLLPDSVEDSRVNLTDSVEQALQAADRISNNSIILVTGSLYLVGDVKKALAEKQMRSQI